jgi:hypothetical protein
MLARFAITPPPLFWKRGTGFDSSRCRFFVGID